MRGVRCDRGQWVILSDPYGVDSPFGGKENQFGQQAEQYQSLIQTNVQLQAHKLQHIRSYYRYQVQ